MIYNLKHNHFINLVLISYADTNLKYIFNSPNTSQNVYKIFKSII